MSEDRPVAVDETSEEPQPKKPKGVPGFGAANARLEAIRQQNYAKVRALAEEFKDKHNSTTLIARRLGVAIETARRWRKMAGVALEPGIGAQAHRQKNQQPRVAEDTPLYKRGWSILQLFDTLLGFFEATETTVSGSLEDEAAIEPKDVRRTWIAWRVFLAALFAVPIEALATNHSDLRKGEPMPAYPGIASDVARGAAAVPSGADAQTIFERCTGRSTWPKVVAKIVALIVGRRGGKSYVTAIIAIYLACCREYKLNLGTRGMVMILARDKEQANVIRSYVLAFLKTMPELTRLLVGEPTQKLIELRHNITIEIRAVGEAGTRGYTVVAALADEIAFWPTDPDSAKQDKKVLRALRPAMLGIPGSMIVMLSSPYAKRGELYEAHRRGYGKDEQTRTFVWQADTLSMRPSDDPDLIAEIASEYEDDEESAKAEYGAEFRSDLESIYSRMAVEAVCVPGRIEQAYQSGRRYRAFVDPSGGSADSYTLAVAHDEQRQVGDELVPTPILDLVREWKPKFDPDEVSREVASVCQSYRVTTVTGDAYGGEWPRDPLKKRGIRYEVSSQNRSELYLAFLPLVNAKRCELLDAEAHKTAVNQFANLERRTGRTGRDSVDHPPGSHDDVSNAVAGVMVSKPVSGRKKATW